MKLRESTFYTLLFGGILAIIALHMYLKNTLQQTIFRNQVNTTPPVERNRLPVSPNKPALPLADSKQDLMDFVKQNIKDIYRQKDTSIKGANFYSQFHQSDLHNEETDLSKYFQIDQSVPTTTNLLQSMNCASGDGVCKQPVKPKVDNLSGNPMYFDQGSDGSLTYKPDIWTYENERTMNGGVFDGIRGQDTMQNDFAIYPAAGQFHNSDYQTSYPYIQSTGKW